VGNRGVETILELRLDGAEKKALASSAEILRRAYAQVEKV
jgi:malate/lactate dehydrogenase